VPRPIGRGPILASLNPMPDRLKRPVSCATCGSIHVSAAYRSENVMYLVCGSCQRAWPIELADSESELDALPDRQKKQHSTYLGDK